MLAAKKQEEEEEVEDLELPPGLIEAEIRAAHEFKEKLIQERKKVGREVREFGIVREYTPLSDYVKEVPPGLPLGECQICK